MSAVLKGLLLWAFAVSAIPGADEAPVTRLLDTGVSVKEQASGQVFTIPNSWQEIPEDQTNHAFSGEAVLRNDKLAVLLRNRGRGLEIFSQTASGLQPRASLGLLQTDSSSPGLLEKLNIIENSASAVSVQATVKGAGPVLFRLTTGEATLEIQPGSSGGFVELRSNARYLVVPDYFGDDLVYPADSAANLCLPAEHFCLNLLEGEDAIIMTVWKSSQQDAWLTRSGDVAGSSSSCRVRCLKDQKIWLALLEAPGIWRKGTTAAGLNWGPPFPAKWRASLVRADALAHSWDLEKGPAQEDPQNRGPVILYPLDRSPSTPLTATCTTDVMRNTLGVGPCQYILSCEGMAAQGDPTPNSVMGWVEKQFEQKKQKKAADEISERLEIMNHHVAEAHARIERYAEFASGARKALSDGGQAFLPIVEGMQQLTAAGLASAASPARSRELANQVLALVSREDVLPECRRLGQELRALGTVQDSTLAKCRMSVRRLLAQARSLCAAQPQSTEDAKRIQGRAEQMLRNQ